ncbi:hypothetical protein Py04_1123 [Pyrococcus sp. ST04]|nr:hypothetical protein Py04_1123 [Pyrococcus sp. ST04]
MDNFRSAIDSLIVVLMSALSIGLLLGYSAALITVIPYKKGFDPDLLATPLITSLSDIITIPTLIFFLHLYEVRREAFYLIFAFMVLLLVVLTIKTGGTFDRSFREISGILTGLVILEAFAGSILETYSSRISRAILLAVLYPSILDSLGNIGSVGVAKLSTYYHLEGRSGVLNFEALLEVIVLALLAIPLGIIANLVGIVIVEILLHSKAGIIVPLILGFPLITVTILAIGISMVLLSEAIHLDPDNLGVPLITTIADVLGTIFIVSLAS